MMTRLNLAPLMTPVALLAIGLLLANGGQARPQQNKAQLGAAKVIALQVANTTTPSPSPKFPDDEPVSSNSTVTVPVLTTPTPTPVTTPGTSVKGSSSSILFGVVVAVVILMLGCLLYFMFFGSQRSGQDEQTTLRPNGETSDPIQARKSQAGGQLGAKSPLPGDPQPTVRSNIGALAGPPTQVPPAPAPAPALAKASSRLSANKSSKSILKSGKRSKA